MPASAAGRPRRCPACQTEARQSAVYCRMCGLQLPTEESRPQAVNGGLPGRKGVTYGLCSACGYKNMRGETFCEGCGVQLPPVNSPPPSLPSRISEL